MAFERFEKKQVSRRWFLGLSGAAASAAGLAAAGCGGGKKSGGSPRTAASASKSTASPRAGGSPASGTPGQRGETLRYTGYVVGDGQFDPHKTQAGPFYGQQALVFSRLLDYQSQQDGKLAIDLATNVPEQPDAQTLVFHLNKDARWHDADPLNGRQVTAQDVQFSIQRQMQGDSSFVRKARWANIDTIETPDPSTITFHLKAPMASMVEAFADVNSFIVAPELVAGGRAFTASTQIGSGPFKWVDWQEGQFASVARNPKWHGGNGRPFLDGVTLTQPKDTSEVEAKLRTKKLDVAFVGRPQADKLKSKTELASLQEQTVGHSLFFGMRFFLQTAPFNDIRFRTALSLALDRRDMLQQFFSGSGEVNPWISWPIKRWTLPQSELVTLAGYRPGAAGRTQDITDAKGLLAAYVAEKPLPAPLNLYVLDDAERAIKMGTVMREQLKQTLNLDVTVSLVNQAQLGSGLLDGSMAWAAAPDNGWIDLDDWVYPYFHSAGTKNTFPLRDADLDKVIESQRTELDANKRRDIGYDIQRKLLVLNPAVNFVSETLVSLAWPYVRDFPLDASDGYQHRFADCWIDRSQPDFKGR
jgi:peptide/nickel transport system substrate-binding protein